MATRPWLEVSVALVPSTRPMWSVCVCGGGGGGGGNTPVHMLFGDVPLFRVWFFDRPLINRVRNSMIFEDFL